MSDDAKDPEAGEAEGADVGVQVDVAVEDDTEDDLVVPPLAYDITSYGADFDVEGVVRRLERDDIIIPSFQRNYVWRLPEASRFIESLLLGLPVPGIFLAKEQESNRFLVIDGQQRLKTLQFFRGGYFNPKSHEKRHRPFKLTGVQAAFEGRSYESLSEADRRQLNDSIIHATVVKQESPPEDDTSVFHIFERLNSGGRKLNSQEIRCAIYHGRLMDLVKELNDFQPWRQVFGPRNDRLKDQELILRFLALRFSTESYSRPMAEFINRFSARNRTSDDRTLAAWGEAFKDAIGRIHEAMGRRAFRPDRALNAAVFDSVMVGVSRQPEESRIDAKAIGVAYDKLIANSEYREAVSRSTADEVFVERRTVLASEHFACGKDA